MQTLSAVDIRRIVNGGERFMLIDVTDSTARGTGVHIPIDGEFLHNVLEYAIPGALPIVIQGDANAALGVEQAATTLRSAGFLEVWTFFETWPGVQDSTAPSFRRHNVVSDPEADGQARHARLLQLK